jgi:hypothetical protein
MKRRAFVHTAVFSAIGIGISPSLPLFSFFQPAGVNQWLRQLLAATKGKRLLIAPVATASFQELTTSLNVYFAKRGYIAEHPDYFFYKGQENTCLYALKLRHAASGMCDILVPVLTIGPDGNWHHTNTLTGYQVEALARAADALADQPIPLQQLLLPSGAKARIPAHLGFSSNAADISFSTRIQGGKALTSIAVNNNGQILFQDSFESKHCLTNSLNIQV